MTHAAISIPLQRSSKVGRNVSQETCVFGSGDAGVHAKQNFGGINCTQTNTMTGKTNSVLASSFAFLMSALLREMRHKMANNIS